MSAYWQEYFSQQPAKPPPTELQEDSARKHNKGKASRRASARVPEEIERLRAQLHHTQELVRGERRRADALKGWRSDTRLLDEIEHLREQLHHTQEVAREERRRADALEDGWRSERVSSPRRSKQQSHRHAATNA